MPSTFRVALIGLAAAVSVAASGGIDARAESMNAGLSALFQSGMSAQNSFKHRKGAKRSTFRVTEAGPCSANSSPCSIELMTISENQRAEILDYSCIVATEDIDSVIGAYLVATNSDSGEMHYNVPALLLPDTLGVRFVGRNTFFVATEGEVVSFSAVPEIVQMTCTVTGVMYSW